MAEASWDQTTRPVLEKLDLLGGGNLLAALGLIAYTEALGRVRLWNRTHRHGGNEECFLAFFNEMDGGRYGAWRDRWEDAHPTTSLYEALRCGLVHEYRPKVDSGFWIEPGADLGLDEVDGRLIFKVEPYYRHFCAEVDRLYAELMAAADPEIPPPFFVTRRKPGPQGQLPPITPISTTPTS